MDKRNNPNLWIRNNARMIARLRFERRDAYSSLARHYASIRQTRALMLNAESDAMREMLAGRIANQRKWIHDLNDRINRTSRAIAILSR